MSTLVTFPGRAGDLLWALPTIRSISEYHCERVDLLIAGEFASLIPLLRQQDYLGVVVADPGWSLSHGWKPPADAVSDHGWGRVYHLGYRRWPENALPYETYLNLPDPTIIQKPDLSRPWITIPDPIIPEPQTLAVGFTEAWFELKLGLLHSLDLQLGWTRLDQLTIPGSRWTTEGAPLCVTPCDWITAAWKISASQIFFGDCSALHVLAVGLGKPVILMEPMIARHNPIFYPLGKAGNGVTLVLGNDGEPTFDARHCKDVLERALGQISKGK